MEKIIVIKYGELTTKKGNRKLFINKLLSNINKSLKGIEYNLVHSRVRMYIETSKENIVIEKLKKVFGIHAIVVARKLDRNIEDIQKNALEIIKNYETFKIDTKRADKRFEINSLDFNRLIANYILKNSDSKVDVHNPDILLNIEIRDEGTFIFEKEIKGLGGYPVGIQGKGLVMLSGGIDSPVALYLALKRGVSCEAIYFDSPPHTSIEARNKVIKLVEILNDYGIDIKLHVVRFTELQEAIYKNVEHNYLITIMRRMMYKIASKYATDNDFKVLINGESIGQVASQTLDSMFVVNEVTNMPIIRPVACLDKLEIIEISKKIGTYETSIIPFEDCCTVFVPKHPVINPKLERCLEFEQQTNYDKYIEKCLNNIEIIADFNQSKYEDLF